MKNGLGHDVYAGLKPMLSTWKPFGLTQRVEFIRLSRTEAGTRRSPADSKMKNGLGHHVNETVFVFVKSTMHRQV